MDYPDLLARLVAARRFGMKLGLPRMHALLAALGAPERRLGTVIHVAGTNGKGSTVAMIAALASASGAKVATYTSPHLSTLRERIVVGGELATEAAIVAAAERVLAAADPDPDVERPRGDDLTFFEQVTAIAMVLIADAAVDITILEVGLGGRLDATNAVDAPIAVVTGVALDHEAILGATLDAIAREKAGIFKRGQHAIVGASGEAAAVPVLVEAARAAGVASLTVIDDAMVARVPPVALAGAHQRRNAAAALAAVAGLGIAVDAAAVLGAVRHPGRFERVGDVILDGAHNPHGAAALATTLRAEALRPVLVIAVSADKDARAIADALAPAVSAVVVTRYQQERALPPAELAAVFAARGLPVTTAPDLAAALVAARSLGATILVAGSLFLVGEARVLLLGAPADPVRVTDPVAPPK